MKSTLFKSLLALTSFGLILTACSSVPNDSLESSAFDSASFPTPQDDQESPPPPALEGEGLVFTLLQFEAIDGILENNFDLAAGSDARLSLAANANLFPFGNRSIIGTKELVSVMALACLETTVDFFVLGDRDAMFMSLMSRLPSAEEESMINTSLDLVSNEKKDFFECVLVSSLPEVTSLIQ